MLIACPQFGMTASAALGNSGRLIYVGAGTSARVAVQDGAELTPTFAWPQERLRFIIAGGESAFAASVEGAEDDVADGDGRPDVADQDRRHRDLFRDLKG